MNRNMFFAILGYIALIGQLYLIFQGEDKIYSYACMILALVCFGAALWTGRKK